MSDNPFALSNIEPQQDSAPASDNPFALGAIQRDQRQDLRVNLESAVRTNPQQAAEAARLAKKYETPDEVLLRNLQDVKLRDAVAEADKKLQTSPRLADYMRTSPFALKQAHDDIDALASIEKFFADSWGSVKAGVYNANRGAGGLFQAVSEVIAPPLDWMESMTSIGGNPLRRLAEGFALNAQQSQAFAKAAQPKTDGIVSGGVQSGIQSLTQNVLALPVAVMNPAAGLGMMSGFAGGQSYSDAREKGLTTNQALPYAASQAAIEAATEKIPLGKLLDSVKEGTPFFKSLVQSMAAEIPGEQVATVLQDLNEWAVLNPEKPFSSYLEERPSAAAQTLIATIVGTGGNVAVVKAAESVANRMTTGAQKARDAQAQVQKLMAAMQAAEASTLRTNNPDEFRAVMEHLAQDGKVYVYAQVLNQLPPEQLQALGVVESLPEALAANSSVEVKLSDLLTHAPGTPAAQVLIDNARATPDGLSAIEVQQASDQAGEFIKTEAERVLAEAQDATAWQDSTNKVKQGVLDQLNSAGRFSPEVNEAYATLPSSFFSVMAQWLGTTPEELFARYNLRVEAKLPGQGERLDQGGENWMHGSLGPLEGELRPGTGTLGEGFYLTNGENQARLYPKMHAIKNKVANPDIRVTQMDVAPGLNIYQMDSLPAGRVSVEKLREAGYDGVRYRNELNIFDLKNVRVRDTLNQSTEQPRLMAVHNLSAENLIFADKMGGLAVPSIGVVTQDAGAVDGFGEITLIGRKGLVDPKQERVFSADAYTVRFPKPEWPKVKSKDAQALVDFVRAAAKEFDDGGLTGETWGNMVNTPDAAKVVEKWTYSSAVKAMFLREKGVDVQPAMRPVRTTSGLTVEQFEALRPLYEQVSKQHDEGQYGTPEEAELKQRVEDGLRETYAELGKRDVMVDKMVEKATYRLVDTLYSDARAVQTGPTVDTWDTGKKINEQIEPYAIEFKQWVESKIIPKFGDPFIKVGGKKAPYTLDNIVKTMTDTKVKGKEKTMTYGAGQVRAASSIEFSDLDQMRAAAVENVVDPAQYEAAKAETEKKLDDYRSAVVEFTNATNWKGDPDTWEALDASMRALAKWSTGKKRDATSMKAALRAEDFNVAKIPDSVIEQAMDAAGALLRAPVPYFEAKPQRAVSLGEFAGAVIPTDAPQQVRDILAKNNVPVTEYEPGADRTSTAREFAAQLAGQGQDTLFQTATPAPTSLPDTIEVDGKQRPTTNSNGQPIAATEEGVRNFWKWFGESAATERAVSSKQRRNELRPLVVYHGTRASFDSFAPVREGNVTTMFGDEETVTRHGIFFAESSEFADTFAKQAGEGNANVVPVYLKIENPLYLDEGFTDEVISELVVAGLPDEQAARLRYRKADMAWAEFDDEAGAAMVSAIRAAGYDGALMVEPGVGVEGEDAQTVWVALDPTQIKSAIGNSGEFDPANPSILAQNNQAPRGTYSPSQVLITLGESADLSTFLHESGHFFLEVMADLASQPDAPQQIRDNMDKLLAWFGIKGDESVGGADSGGELAQFAGQNAASADMVALSSAQQRVAAGEDAENVRRETGWFTGADGKWRFEISDDRAHFVKTPKLKEYLTKKFTKGKKLSKADKTALDTARAEFDAANDAMFALADRKSPEFDAAFEKRAEAQGKVYALEKRARGDFTKLGDILVHDTLFAAYPELREVGVSLTVDPAMENTAEGTFDTRQNRIVLSAKTEQALLENLFHEIQHAIQMREGYARGGSPNSDGGFAEYRRLAGEVEARNTASRAGLTPDQRRDTAPSSTADVPADAVTVVFAQDGNLPTDNTQPAGRTPLEVWNAMTLDQKRPYHERFAESFEAYLLEGKAPSAELQPLFRKFRSWLVNVYKSLSEFMRGRNLDISPEIRQVFDRMLATDEQIRQAEDAAGMLPDFDATNEAIEKLQARSLRDLKWTVGARSKALKALQREAANLRKAVKAEVTAEVEQMPEFKAQREIAEFKRENKRKANDVERAIIAEANGFESADAMAKAIDLVGKKADMIEGMTDQRMLENFGELATPEALEAAANDAVHNEARARALATELKAQADMLNPRQDTGRTASNGRSITVNALTAAAKQFAQNLTARRRVKDLKNAAWQHRSAESRAAKAWQEATAKGKTEEAVAAKRDQLLNNYTAKAMGEAQAEVRKVLEFFAKVTKGNNEKLVDKGRDPDVVNAARAVLAAYDIAPRLEKTANDYMEAVAKYDAQMYGALKPGLDAMLANAKPFGELTVDEMRALRDEIGSMWELAKTSRQMEIDGDRVDIDDAAQDLVNRMVEIGVPDEIPGEKGAITNRQELGIKLQFAKAILSRVEQWAERMDGKFGGPFLRYVFQPVKDAADRYRAARVQYREKFTKLVEGVAPFIKPGPIAAPELGYTFGNARDSGMAELLHALTHTGNDSNKRKLLLGRNWATENADGTLDTTRWDTFVARLISEGTLRKEHYDFAQGVWDLLEETKPLAQEAHRKVFGRYFAEVTANEFTTPFGVYRGGYAPAQTDSRLVGDAKLRELAEGENESMAYAFPSAPSGFTKSRVEYNKPLLLDLRALAQHMDKVLLFSHMQPAISDARRLLTRKNVSYALDRIDPGAYEGMIMPWLNRSAKQIVETPVAGDRKLSRFLSAARSRAGMAMMMANLSNTVQQITGFSTAAIKVKPSLMLKAVGQFTASPKEFKRSVAEASAYMKDRMLNELSSMNDVVEQILVDPTLLEKGQAWTQKHAYFLQSAVDNTMSPIIWTAAYNQAIEEGSEARDAVRFADGVIRQTQGSTLPEDVSRFETGPAVMRVFTQFVGYFNMMANTNATAMSQVVSEMGVKKGAGKLAYIALAGLLVPIWVAEAIAQAFRGGPGDEDDDGYLDDWLMAVFGLGTLRGMTAQIPIAGQVGQMAVSRFNNNPADDKFSLSPAVSLIESAVGSPASVYKAIIEDGNAQKAVRDVAAAATLLTGLPFYAAARPVGYAAGVAQGKIEPTDAVDAVRGTVTGTASKESKTP